MFLINPYRYPSTKVVPTVVGVGTRGSGTGAITPTIHASSIVNDIMLLVCESANETITAPSGWTAILNSPQGEGTAGAIGSTSIYIFWKRHTGSETNPTVADPGDHVIGIIITIRGCVTSGNPWSDVAGNTEATIDTSFSGSGPTTVDPNELVLICMAVGADASTARWNTANNMACASLSSITNWADECTTSGNGGGVAIWSGTKATAGAVGTCTATANSITEKAWLILGLRPV